MTCTVCRHAKRRAIESALVKGTPGRAIASRYGLSKAALDRHKANDMPKAVAQAEALVVKEGVSVIEQIRALAADAQRIKAKAESQGDLRTALQGVRELTRIVELAATLTGQMPQAGQVVVHTETVQVIYGFDPSGFPKLGSGEENA